MKQILLTLLVTITLSSCGGILKKVEQAPDLELDAMTVVTTINGVYEGTYTDDQDQESPATFETQIQQDVDGNVTAIGILSLGLGISESYYFDGSGSIEAELDSNHNSYRVYTIDADGDKERVLEFTVDGDDVFLEATSFVGQKV